MGPKENWLEAIGRAKQQHVKCYVRTVSYLGTCRDCSRGQL